MIRQKPPCMYLVVPGDTLGHISKRHYGFASGAETIYDCNRNVLTRGPDHLKAGMALFVPSKEEAESHRRLRSSAAPGVKTSHDPAGASAARSQEVLPSRPAPGSTSAAKQLPEFEQLWSRFDGHVRAARGHLFDAMNAEDPDCPSYAPQGDRGARSRAAHEFQLALAVLGTLIDLLEQGPPHETVAVPRFYNLGADMARSKTREALRVEVRAEQTHLRGLVQKCVGPQPL